MSQQGRHEWEWRGAEVEDKGKDFVVYAFDAWACGLSTFSPYGASGIVWLLQTFVPVLPFCLPSDKTKKLSWGREDIERTFDETLIRILLDSSLHDLLFSVVSVLVAYTLETTVCFLWRSVTVFRSSSSCVSRNFFHLLVATVVREFVRVVLLACCWG